MVEDNEKPLETASEIQQQCTSLTVVRRDRRTCQDSINGSTHHHPSPNSKRLASRPPPWPPLRLHSPPSASIASSSLHTLLYPRTAREPGRRKRMQQQQQPARRRSPGAGGGWAAPATVDEASMERSKSFINALQELKNLRPQLYSASEYCEKSYLHAQQKQMVLDNLKDYAVRAVVNAVDHLGTVAYKLTDLFEQQASEISNFELKVARLNQQIFTCQVFVDKEGLRQQQMMGANMKHHKHYILPSTGYKRTQAVAHLGTDTNQESKPRPYPSAKTLSWHLASDTSPSVNGAQKPTFILGDNNVSPKLASDGLFLLGKELPASPMRKPLQLNRNTKPDDTQKSGAKDQSGLRHMSTFSSFDRPKGREIQKVPVGTKSMLTTLFIKHKSAKMKKISAR